MNFPRWIRSEVTIAYTSDADKEEVCRRIARTLESRGATGIEVREGKAHFRAERAMGNWNPLTPCRKGAFQVEEVHDGIRVEYELDLLYLLVWTSAVALFPCVFGLIVLLQGNVVPLAQFAVFFGASIPLNYTFYFWRSKSLFRNAVLLGSHL